MSEKSLLKKSGKYENLVRTYTELAELNAEQILTAAEREAKAGETRLRRELAERNFASLDRETVKQAILADRIAKENKQLLDLQFGALRAGKALSEEDSAKLAETHERRLRALAEQTERELADFPAPTMDPAEAAKNTAETEEQIRALRERILGEAKEKAEAARAKYAPRIAAAQQKLEAVEQQLASEHGAPVGELAEGLTLSVTDLKMYFGGVKAVDGLSFNVKEGEIFGLIGPNGAGKTTVFNCITQFYKPTGGTLLFRTAEGKVIDLTREKVHDVILHGIVRTFQNVEVVREMTVLENLLVAGTRQFTTGLVGSALHLRKLKLEERVVKARAEKVLDFMGLTLYRDYLAFGLPYGVLKKIEIARTLMCSPRLIILDEPAAGLNDTETAELSRLIRRIRDEYHCTILLVEHDMGLVMEVCDSICAISFGKLLAYGTPAEIQANKEVQQAYLGVEEEEAE